MINFNGKLLPSNSQFLNHTNRGLKYGDALFETIRVVHSKLYFWEDHYLRLMAAMRILRMEIPMSFTMEFLEEEIQNVLKANQLQTTPARVRLSVFRDTEGFYTPEKNTISYCIEVSALSESFYALKNEEYVVELYKDHWVNADLLSTLKSANKIINIIAGVYARENDYDNCLLLNQQKNIVEAINGNIFLVKGTQIKTPPLSDGCLNGILRKQLIMIIGKHKEYTLEETSISPFELQKADELFVTNVIQGIVPISRYRRKNYERKVSGELIKQLNIQLRLN